MRGSYPCFLGSSWLDKDEVSVRETQSARHELPRLVILAQQHSIYLRRRVEESASETAGRLTFGVLISCTLLTGPSSTSNPVAEFTNLLLPTDK